MTSGELTVANVKTLNFMLVSTGAIYNDYSLEYFHQNCD